MFMGSLRSSPGGSRAGDEDEEEEEEALTLGELGGGVPGVCWTSLSTSFSSLPLLSDEPSLEGASCHSSGAERAEETVASRLARRGVSRILPLSEDMALTLALRPLSPLPCLKQGRRCSQATLAAQTQKGIPHAHPIHRNVRPEEAVVCVTFQGPLTNGP